MVALKLISIENEMTFGLTLFVVSNENKFVDRIPKPRDQREVVTDLDLTGFIKDNQFWRDDLCNRRESLMRYHAKRTEDNSRV
jgi:hypothetical protein